MSEEPQPAAPRARRAPPPFRPVTVLASRRLSPRLMCVSLTGDGLCGFTVDEPAASVRLLLPPSPTAPLVMPAWNGNEFLLADGRRPVIRTLTPLRVDPAAGRLDVEIVLHGPGAASEWAAAARPGLDAAVSGPGRGHIVDRDAAGYLLAGDETAIPAISQLLEAVPPDVPVRVIVEATDPDARLPLPPHPRAAVEWIDLPGGRPAGDALVDAVRSSDLGSGRIWVAGEAAAVQRIRRHLFEERSFPRRQATVRGYWKQGEAAAADAE